MMVEVEADRVEAAYRKIHARLWRALLAYTGSRDLASDAEAEAFAQVMRRGDEVADVEAWVWRASFRIAGGLLVDRQRSVLATPDGPSPEEGATVEFLAMLDGVSRQQREIVVLRYVGGFTPTEIADRIDSTPGAVRVQLHRAHQVLRGYVREETQGDH